MQEEMSVESTMNKKQIIRVAQLTLTVLAALTLIASAGAKNRSKKIIVVRPTDLPELARVPGEAMILHATDDGKNLLYVEQNNGARSYCSLKAPSAFSNSSSSSPSITLETKVGFEPNFAARMVADTGSKLDSESLRHRTDILPSA